MKLAASVLVVVLAGCTSDGGGNADPGGTNPPTLWLAMSSSDAMKLVGEEPRPY